VAVEAAVDASSNACEAAEAAEAAAETSEPAADSAEVTTAFVALLVAKLESCA
jgi:hypothetical protein